MCAPEDGEGGEARHSAEPLHHPLTSALQSAGRQAPAGCWPEAHPRTPCTAAPNLPHQQIGSPNNRGSLCVPCLCPTSHPHLSLRALPRAHSPLCCRQGLLRGTNPCRCHCPLSCLPAGQQGERKGGACCGGRRGYRHNGARQKRLMLGIMAKRWPLLGWTLMALNTAAGAPGRGCPCSADAGTALLSLTLLLLHIPAP